MRWRPAILLGKNERPNRSPSLRFIAVVQTKDTGRALNTVVRSHWAPPWPSQVRRQAQIWDTNPRPLLPCFSRYSTYVSAGGWGTQDLLETASIRHKARTLR